MRSIQFAATVVLGVAACCAQTQPAGPLASKNILILDAHEFGTLASAEIDQGLLAALRNAGVSNSRLHFEFLDMRRYPDPRYRDALAALLRLKYESTKFDLVVAVAPPSLSMVLDDPHGRHPLFEGVPVIGVAVLDERISSTREHPLILLTDHADVRATVITALDLLPGTEHILVVGGVSEYNRQVALDAAPALREWAGRLDISWLNNLPLDDMLRAVSKAPPHSFVLYLGVTADVAGHIYVPTDVAEAIGKVSAAPVFGISDTYVRMGLVGGFVKSYAEEGREAGRVAVRILKGELTLLPAPPPIHVPDLALFDWRQMKRWGLNESRLPKGSVVENRPVTIWSQHPWYVMGTATFTVLESLLIATLWLDMRRRKRVQAELQRTQSLLQAILDGAPDFIFLKDRECRMVMANPAMLRAIGKPAEQVLGKTSRECFDDPELGRAILEHDFRILETGVAESVEETVSGPGGLHILLTTKSPYCDPEGRTIGLIGVSREITERKRAENELRESEARLREAQHLAHVGSSSWDVDSDTTTWSEEMYRITGWDPNRPAPTYDERAALYSPESWARLKEAMQRTLATGEPFELDVDILRPDGAVRRVHASGAAVRDERGRVVRIDGTLQDITDQKLAEEAIRQTNRKLHQLSRDLLRSQDYERRRIARELHDSTAQLLAALSINLGRLRDSALEPDRRAQVLSETIDLAAACSAEIRTVTYLLHPPLLDEVGLADALRVYVQGFNQRTGIGVEILIPRDFGRLASEMETALFRIAQEGLANVHKHSGSRSAVIRLERDPCEVRLVLQDRGHGLPTALLPWAKEFVHFGVGLTGMRERAEQLGGRLELTSDDGGVRLAVTLPLVQSNEENADIVGG